MEPLSRDEIAAIAVRDAREIVKFLDNLDALIASATGGGLERLALGVLALDEQNQELRRQLDERAN